MSVRVVINHSARRPLSDSESSRSSTANGTMRHATDDETSDDNVSGTDDEESSHHDDSSDDEQSDETDESNKESASENKRTCDVFPASNLTSASVTTNAAATSAPIASGIASRHNLPWTNEEGIRLLKAIGDTGDNIETFGDLAVQHRARTAVAWQSRWLFKLRTQGTFQDLIVRNGRGGREWNAEIDRLFQTGGQPKPEEKPPHKDESATAVTSAAISPRKISSPDQAIGKNTPQGDAAASLDTLVEQLSRKRKRQKDRINGAHNSLKKWKKELVELDEKLEIMREAQVVVAGLRSHADDSCEEI